MGKGGYIHGTAPEEQERLSLLNRLMNDASLREVALRGGEKIVDFGCGLGQLTRGFARAAGQPVLGIERSAEQLAEGARQAAEAGEAALLELRQGDAALPPIESHEWGTFDVAHARFVLEPLENLIGILAGARAAIVPAALLDGATFDRALEELRRWGTLPDATFWFAISWAEGARQ